MQKLLLYVAILATTFTACQKEKSAEIPDNTGTGGGTSNGSEIGTWKFIGMQVTTSSTVEMSMLGISMKTVTLSDYKTENNKGTISFDGKKMSSAGLEYTINTTAKIYVYMDGSLDDSLDFPFSATLPPTNSSADYKKISTDSIYLAAGAMAIGENGAVQSIPAGYKLKWNGDKMIMTMNYQTTKTETDQGITQKTTDKYTSVTTLQKQ
jgi:hypothetical protein